MPTPSLTPLAPAPGKPLQFDSAKPVTIGRAPRSRLRLDTTRIAAKHAVIELADGGWWLRPIDGDVELNGAPVTVAVRLRDRDQIRLAANLYYEFATGEPRTRRMTSAADMIARPRKRASGALPASGRRFSLAALASIVVAVFLVVSAGYVAWYGIVRAPKSVAVLDDQQAAEFDALLITAYDHVERGGTLLELGLGDGAADEFAQAVNTLALSRLRNNPQVKPRIEALEATVASIYRERSLAVPGNYASATSPLTADQLKTASLTADEFAAKFGLMAATFAGKFGHSIVVSGRDHAEHVILYGKGGAMDLSVKSMSREEVSWLIGQSHAFHIRVKDFSQDTVLRRQVVAAVKAGLLFEAGTGLHLHIDRFANKRDRWTTLRAPSNDEELDPRHTGDRKLLAVVERPVLTTVEQVLIHVGAIERRIDEEVASVLPDDRAVISRDESLRVAQHQIIPLLRPIRLGRTNPEDRAVDRIDLSAPDAINDLQHRFLTG